MRIVVTGGAGFIGSHLCERLIGEGHQVVCVDNFSTGTKENIAPLMRNSRFSYRVIDITVGLGVAGPIDRIYNLACPASPKAYQADPIQTMRTCVAGSWNVLEAARLKGARVLQASTSEVYGDPAEHPQTEDYPGNVNCTGPRACYDEGKRAAEALFYDFNRQHGVDVRVARIFNTYGPRMQPDDGRVIPAFISRALAGEPVTIHGDGRQTRSFCFVDDTVSGLIALMESDETRPVNIGNPNETGIIGLVREIAKLTGVALLFERGDRPIDDPNRRCPDISRARAIGWNSTVSLDDGLKRTISYFTQKIDNLASVA